jgi:hypothetical protein
VQLLVAGAQLGVEALVLERQHGRRARRPHQLGWSSSDALWMTAAIRSPSRSISLTARPATGGRQLDAPALGVDEEAGSGSQ